MYNARRRQNINLASLALITGIAIGGIYLVDSIKTALGSTKGKCYNIESKETSECQIPVPSIYSTSTGNPHKALVIPDVSLNGESGNVYAIIENSPYNTSVNTNCPDRIVKYVDSHGNNIPKDLENRLCNYLKNQPNF